jgi:type I restriction enzyme S subunit
MSDELPQGWSRARVGDLALLVQYGSSAKTSEDPAGVPVLRMGNIVDGRLNLQRLKYLPRSHDEFPELFLEPGDVLFNRTNSPELVGKTAVFAEGHPSPCSFASYLIRVRLRDYEPRLFAAFLNSEFGRAWIRSCVTQQTGQANVSGGKLKDLEVPVPPPSEQRRIVRKLDGLQARSRRAREALEAVPPLLEKLRQSILAAAFRGDLTKDWRAKNPDVEPASELLKRIRLERRKQWEEAELAKMQAKGRVPGDDRWKAKYDEPPSIDARPLPTLPKRWCWATIGEVALLGGGLTKHAAKRAGGRDTPLVSVAAVQLRYIDVSAIGSIQLVPDDGDKGELRAGDLLVVEGNGSLSHIGRVALWGNEVEGARHQNHLIRIRPTLLQPSYALEWLASPLGRADIIDLATSATGLYTLSLSKVAALPIPLAPQREQDCVVQAITLAMTAVTSLAGIARRVDSRLGLLERAFLSKAFRGELGEVQSGEATSVRRAYSMAGGSAQ